MVQQFGVSLGFTEGPLWTSTGRLLVTSVSRGLVCEIELGGGGLVSSVEVGGGPNGLAEDDAGRVWVAQNGGRTMPSRSDRQVRPGLQRIENGAVREVVGGGFEAPNDLTVGPDGRIWFTDPGVRETGPGQVYAYDPVTGATTLAADGLEYPNGLAFGPDGALVVAETRTRRVLRYTLSNSELSFEGVFGALPDGGADGLAFTADGRLLAATPAADLITVFDADGRLQRPLRFDGPTFPTNLCFAGADLDVLVVTAAKGGRVLALQDVGQGLPLPGARSARV
jgi:gluconolactonase